MVVEVIDLNVAVCNKLLECRYFVAVAAAPIIIIVKTGNSSVLKDEGIKTIYFKDSELPSFHAAT